MRTLLPTRATVFNNGSSSRTFENLIEINYENLITIEPGKRGGQPRIRGMRIAVSDVLGWLAAGMTREEILDDYPELTEEDIRACLAYATDQK